MQKIKDPHLSVKINVDLVNCSYYSAIVKGIKAIIRARLIEIVNVL